MYTKIINQYEEGVYGLEFNETLDAYNKDKTSLVCNNKTIDIIESTKTDEELIIKVDISTY